MNTPIQFPDEVDRFADRLLDDPSRVEDLKAELRARLQGNAIRAARRRVLSTAEPDDLWDNLPV